jgi:hypothetical protein
VIQGNAVSPGEVGVVLSPGEGLSEIPIDVLLRAVKLLAEPPGS